MVSACATPAPRDAAREPAPARADASAPNERAPRAAAAPDAGAAPAQPRRANEIFAGTGSFIDERAAAPPSYNRNHNGDVTLNFDGADIVEVVKTILGDILEQNYAVDPQVQGQVTLQTSRPVSEGALITVLESLLRMNGAVLVKEPELYRVMPATEAAAAAMRPTLRPGQGAGYQVVVVPLRYIAAEEMRTVLQLVQGDEQGVRVDAKRNLLVLSGTQGELSRLLQTVDIFDVDQFEGMSFGLFRLDYVEVGTLIDDLGQIFTEMDLPVAGMVRFMPVERMNALIAITPQKEYLEDVETWVERLDQAELVTGTGLFVYRVQNRNAVRLAEILQTLFSAAAESGARRQRESAVAPGMTTTVTESRGATEEQAPPSAEQPAEPVVGEITNVEPAPGQVTDVEPVATPAPAPNPAPSASPAQITFDVGDAQVIADEENNALLVMASGADYRQIEQAIRRLDTAPLQVLIEASIVDVILTDELRFGVEWFVKHGLDGAEGEARFDVGALGAGAASGFSYTVVDAAGEFEVVLNALAEESRVNVLSSPSLMVLDNRTAEIRVGNQQPVQTQTATTEGGVIVESIEFKDTGVILEVTPRVNFGGLVTMEISQEVTDVGNIDPATQQRSFLQRNITSTVAVKSGQTIVLGGLITENQSVSESGIPILYRLPVVGKLFGTTETSTNRNELIVLITPRVLPNAEATDEVIRDFREKMPNLDFDAYTESPPLPE